MKSCILTFVAVLAAIIVAVLGFAFVGHLGDWNNIKTAQVRALTDREKGTANLRKMMTADDDGTVLRESEEMIVAMKEDLLALYGRKPMPLSSDERAQVTTWAQDIRQYKAAHAEAH